MRRIMTFTDALDPRAFLKEPRARGYALAQGCALLSAISAIASTALANRGANFPAWQSFILYALLAAYFVPAHARARYLERSSSTTTAAATADDARTSDATPGIVTTNDDDAAASAAANPGDAETKSTRTLARYALLAAIDTQANYCIVKAFKYTSLTSVTLLDCAAIPFSMALGAATLGSVFSRAHVSGGAIAFAGLAIIVLADASSSPSSSSANGGGPGSNPALGDFLVVVAAFLYACSNVMQEASLLDGATAPEILAHVGGIGACISGLQCAAFESEELASANEAGGFVGFCLFAAFAASLFAMYAAVPSVLSLCGAAAFNVNMLSADLWAAAARVMIFGGFGSWASGLSFVASLAVVTIGLVVFAAAGEPLPPDRKRDGAVEMRYEVLDEEGGGGGDAFSSGRA